MASRKRPKFVPKKKQAKKTGFDFEIKIVGGLANERSNDSSMARNSRIRSLQDFEKELTDVGFTMGKTSDGESRTGQDHNKQYIKYKLNFQAGSKPSAFEKIRQEWCTRICRPGCPFWLESSESIRDTFRYKAETSRHGLQPISCSFGSFFDRGTFVEHYTTQDDVHLIEDGVVYSEFVHDTKALTLAFSRKYKFDLEDFGVLIDLPGYEMRIEFEYKQFEDYILVEENNDRIDLYLPLIRPPKVTKVEEILDKTKETRCVSFLNCTQEILGKSSVLRLRFETSKKNDRTMELIKRLGTLSHTVYFVAMKTKKPCGPTEIPVKPNFDSFEVAYALECLLSRGFKVTDRVSRKFYDLLRSAVAPDGAVSTVSRRSRALQPSQRICRALYQLIAFVDSNRFCPMETVLEQLLFGKFKTKTALDFELPKHYVYVPRIIVTPTQDFLVQPELVAENRVIRQYRHEYAMRIAFREEDFSKMSSFGDSLEVVLKKRVVEFLKKGIHLCGRHFEFLACSNSQLRDHGAWLYANDGEVSADDIRQSLGELESFRCVATFVSRMGQCFSSTKESVKVSIDDGVEASEIEEIEKQYNNEFFECCGNFRTGMYVFSDGIGKISQALAKDVRVRRPFPRDVNVAILVAESLGLRKVPSAYQIRYAGCKGMLALDPNLPQGKKILQYRNSMRKFECSHKDLEICEYSRPNLLYLNRQCITLLSGLGVPDESFIKLQDIMLMRLASMLLFENVALEMLSHASVAGGLKISTLRKSGIMVTCEPFFRSLLLAMYKSKLGDLLRRARIAVPQSHGRLLVGVLDETQTLEYGQVFIRYTKDISEPDKEFFTLTGNVVVTKNPCFHPGDMRKLQAVDIKALHHLVNCIVFPAKGPRPHTNEISGSDLDGDKYFVTWHPSLIPPNDNEKPMDFPSPKKRLLDRRVVVEDMIEFVAEYIKNDQLGPIANSHLVHADSEDKGVKSEKCIKLAHMHSDAVDFPKTGECPSLTQDLRPDQYPDFMMKTDKPRYKSKGILGKLFQKCNQLERARYFISEESPKDLQVDPDLILEGYQDYVDSAIERRDRYNTKLGSLMALYGLKDEGEVLTGCLTKVHSRVSGKTDEKFEVAQLIQASIASLRNHLKTDFYEEFGGEEEVKQMFEEEKEYPIEVLLKASAWYVVTYNKIKSPSQDSTPEENVAEEEVEKDDNVGDEWAMSDAPLISFPWIVSPILAHIKASANKDAVGGKTQEMQDISRLITVQADNLFFDATVRQDMIDDFEMRQNERDSLLRLISARSSQRLVSMPLLGASMTGLNIRDKNPQPLQLYAHSVVILEFERILRGMRIVHHNSVLLDHSRTTLHFKLGDQWNCSITTNQDELLKSVYIYRHIERCPRLLHLLLVIMHWGRKRHMTGSSRDSFMSVEDLAVLFIRFCEGRKFIEEIKKDELKEHAVEFLNRGKAKETEWRTEILDAEAQTNKGFLDGTEPGMTLIKFFEFHGNDSEKEPLHILKITNPVQPASPLFHYLPAEDVQRFRDASLHSYHEIAQCRGLDRILKTAEHENSKEMQETLSMPNCTWGALRFAEDFVAHGLSALTGAKVNIRPATRRSGYIMEARGNYLSLYKCQVERQKLETKSSNSFVFDHTITGGCYFFFIGQASAADRVTAKALKKDFAVNLDSANPSGCEDEKLVTAVTQQLEAFNNNYVRYLHGSDTLRISLEYGSIYVHNAHAWVLGSNVGVVEQALRASADPKNRGNHGRGNNQIPTPGHKFIPLHSNLSSLSDIEVRLSVLGEVRLVQDEKFYMVEIQTAKNHDLKIVYDENLKFERYEFEPFKWLVSDLKTPRPSTSRTRDIDLRVLMTSPRELDTQKAQELPIYETYGKTEIIALKDGQPVVLPEYRRGVTFVHEVTKKVYLIDRNGSVIFVEVSTIKKKNQNNRSNRNRNSDDFWTLKLYGDFKSTEVDEARKLIRDILSLGKDIKPRK